MHQHIYIYIYVPVYIYIYVYVHSCFHSCVRSTVHVPSDNLRTWKWSPIPERYMFLQTPYGPGSGPPPPITRHRFGHQSGLDESSVKIGNVLHGIAFPVCVVFSKKNRIIKYE